LSTCSKQSSSIARFQVDAANGAHHEERILFVAFAALQNLQFVNLLKTVVFNVEISGRRGKQRAPRGAHSFRRICRVAKLAFCQFVKKNVILDL
jgi:hypothetical protein